MKAKALLVALCLMGMATTSDAQQKTVRMRQQPTAFSPVTKGYYAIGRNIEKLYPAPSGLVVQESNSEQNVQKGYYSIGKNRNKLRRQQVIQQQDGTPLNPPAKRSWPTKGYYGIGNNAEKLQ